MKRTREQDTSLRAAVEAMLFAAAEPLTPAAAARVIRIGEEEALAVLRGLAEEYRRDGRGFEVQEVAGGFRLTTRPELAPLVRSLIQGEGSSSLSHAALEALAVVAYRQPVTRAQVEMIRGVNCEKVLAALVEKGLVQEVGRGETVGRPILYGTTREFLQYFGLGSLADLPPLEGAPPSLFPAHAPPGDRES